MFRLKNCKPRRANPTEQPASAELRTETQVA